MTKSQVLKVLLVEDNHGDARLVQEMLAESIHTQFQVKHARFLAEALELIEREQFDIALVDLSLPDAHGLCTVNHVQNAAPSLPIVVLSGMADEDIALHTVQSGAQDYLIKGHGNGDTLSRALHYAIERKQDQQRLAYLAQYDTVTALPNRNLFRDRLVGAFHRAQRKGSTVVLMFLDLDRFKHINDTLGHDIGDAMLKAVAERLSSVVRKEDTVARLGGDEFTILQEGIPIPDGAARVAQSIVDAMAMPFKVQGHELAVTASIGITVYPTACPDIETLMKEADRAMYLAKELGRNTYQFYTPDMNNRARERQSLEGLLRHALERDEFIPHYQPLVDLESGEVCGVEVLLRWRHPLLGVVTPQTFLAVQEETGLIVPVGEWLLHEACLQLQRWRSAGLPLLRLNVNLSARQLQTSGMADGVSAALRAAGLDAGALEIDVAEYLLHGAREEERDNLRALKAMGVRVCVDDFGSGYSSLRVLRQLAVDALKIDASLVMGLEGDPDAPAITDAIISVGSSLGLDVIAEGVETDGQRGVLRNRGCVLGQGYLFSAPMPAAECTAWLKGGMSQAPAS